MLKKTTVALAAHRRTWDPGGGVGSRSKGWR